MSSNRKAPYWTKACSDAVLRKMNQDSTFDPWDADAVLQVLSDEDLNAQAMQPKAWVLQHINALNDKGLLRRPNPPPAPPAPRRVRDEGFDLDDNVPVRVHSRPSSSAAPTTPTTASSSSSARAAALAMFTARPRPISQPLSAQPAASSSSSPAAPSGTSPNYISHTIVDDALQLESNTAHVPTVAPAPSANLPGVLTNDPPAPVRARELDLLEDYQPRMERREKRKHEESRVLAVMDLSSPTSAYAHVASVEAYLKNMPGASDNEPKALLFLHVKLQAPNRVSLRYDVEGSCNVEVVLTYVPRPVPIIDSRQIGEQWVRIASSAFARAQISEDERIVQIRTPCATHADFGAHRYEETDAFDVNQRHVFFQIPLAKQIDTNRWYNPSSASQSLHMI